MIILKNGSVGEMGMLVPILLYCYIGAQSDLTQSTILREKLKAQLLSLIRHMGNNFGCEL